MQMVLAMRIRRHPAWFAAPMRGFGMAMTVSMAAVWMCIIFSRALWWIRKR